MKTDMRKRSFAAVSLYVRRDAVLVRSQEWLKPVVKLIDGIEENRALAGHGGDEFCRGNG